ncbi:MAG: glycosyltransferase [Bdellovibrionales bacterium]|nr:glycosyltransferase [Bdellovibrionales bacterium]
MKKRILFLVNGYGLGNSTRVHAIIQHIGPGYDMDIFAYGNSLKYFKQVTEVRNVFEGLSTEYGTKNGEIDFSATAGKTLKNLKAIYKNREHIKKIIQSRSYNLILSDSNYSPVFLKNRPKMIAINNADITVQSALKINKRGYYGSFITEWMDYKYHSSIPDLTISPSFEPYKDTKNIRHTGLIVRKAFQRSPNPPGKRHHVLVMTGGAEALNQGLSINHQRDDYDLSVIGDQIQISGKAGREGKTFNTSHLMKQATIVVINGGFSSLSEALALAKPMIVIPLKGHIEQRTNALWIEKNNLGVISSWRHLENSILLVKKKYGHFEKNCLSYERLNGAKQAAVLIIKEVESDSLC